MRRTQKTLCSKFLALALLAVLVFPAAPHSANAQVQESSSQPLPLSSVITIPEIVINGQAMSDISRIDWAQKVTINGKTVALNSDEALNGIGLPLDIKKVIRDYRNDKSALDWNLLVWPWSKGERKAGMDDGLKYTIAQKLIEKGELPKNYFDLEVQGEIQGADSIVDLSRDSNRVITPTALTPVEASKAEIVGLTEVKSDQTLLEKVSAAIRSVIDKIVAIVGPRNAYADVATISEDAVNWLESEQNADGSWGTATSTRFMTTVAVVDALQANGITGTTTNDGVAWIEGYAVDNNDYLADQAKILARAGQGTTTIDALVNNLNEDVGGFSVSREFKPDVITTSKVIDALQAANYDDPGAEPNRTASIAIHYLINTQRFDDGWSLSTLGASPITTTAEAVEALLLWKHQSLGATEIDDTLDPALNSLINTQDSDGTWDNDVLNTALAYHAIKAAGEIPTYQLDTVEFFENEQEGNGSFDNDIYKTAKVVKALSIATNSGQLVITDIIPISTIQTGTTTTFDIRMSNPGNVAVDTGKLHLIADDYHLSSFDFQTYGIVVNASSTVDLRVGISNTRPYLGGVKFKVFVEGTSGVIHPGSRYEETLTYATAADNRPATPLWYVAYKNVSGANAAITWRWPIKSDPKLKNVVLMYRLQGATTWSAANVTATTTTSSASISGFPVNSIYEATIGTSDTAGNIYFRSEISTVKVSNVAGNYTDGTAAGTVKALDGIVPDVQIVGVNASTTAQVDEDGAFLQQDVPWGTSYARVNDFRYEAYTERYTNADTNITGVNVYTNLKPDTAIPTVTGVSIVGESDKVMENKETELIQYTVGDDIGSGGGIVKSASFYYYDPSDSNWHLIGTEEGLLTGTRTYAWSIPGSLLGTGYKIKVIARDFAGKDSTATEWGGTFELTAGNSSPEFTFTAPVDATAANANATYTIKWIDEDEDDNATTTLSYDPDNNPSNGNHTVITTVMEDDPADEYVWNTSGIATSTKYIRADLVDGHNGTTTVYSTRAVNISH